MRGGQFWVHNVASVVPINVEDVSVPEGSAGPLLPGMKMTLDGEPVEFTEIRQFEIEKQ